MTMFSEVVEEAYAKHCRNRIDEIRVTRQNHLDSADRVRRAADEHIQQLHNMVYILDGMIMAYQEVMDMAKDEGPNKVDDTPGPVKAGALYAQELRETVERLGHPPGAGATRPLVDQIKDNND